MNLTNIHGLPEPLVKAVQFSGYKKVGKISATGLIKPPRIRVLEERHDDKITEDASDRIWSLLGQSVHEILRRSGDDGHLVEERLSADVLGWQVTGQADLLDADMVLSDWKVTSTYSFLLGDKPEWEQQCQIYAWLYRKAGFSPVKLQIVAILRDWSAGKALAGGDYPKAPVMTVTVPMWDDAKVQEFVEQRVRLHQEAESLPDDQITPCTSEERWDKPTTYAAKKPANKRATRVFDSMTEAEMFAIENGLVVETRPGESTRCARFCRVSDFCAYGKTLEKEVA